MLSISGILGIVVSVAAIGGQLALGMAFLGSEHPIERSKAPGQFWLIIIVETLGLGLAILGLWAFNHAP